jgi:predicted amidohydrolase
MIKKPTSLKATSPTTAKEAFRLTTSRFDTLVTLGFKTGNDFSANLKRLKELIIESPQYAIIVAPEVCLTGFFYEDMHHAAHFSQRALEELLPLSDKKILILTLIEKEQEHYVNSLVVLYNRQRVHSQQKHKLFHLGGELEHFKAGDEKKITPFEIEGIKFGALICFELRFISLWERLQGADLIVIPAMWGAIRKEHFETLAQALGVANQCFVCATNSDNSDMSKNSLIVTPFGNVHKDDRLNRFAQKIEWREVTKMRRYLPVGID